MTNRYQDAVRAGDVGDFCDLIWSRFEQSMGDAFGPRHSPSGLSQSPLSQAQPSVGYRKEEGK